MRSHILARTEISQTPGLDPQQLQLDATWNHFAQEASHPLGIAAMLGGSLTYRLSNLALGRLAAPILAESSLFTRFLSQAAIKAFSVSAEVAAFRGISQGSDNIFSTREFSSDLLNFTLMKSVGYYSRGTSTAINHALQCSVMTLGHTAAYHLGIQDRPEGTILERFLQAETMILQMDAGLRLLHTLSGNRIAPVEKAIDFENELRLSAPSFRENRLGTLVFRTEETEQRLDPLDAEARKLAEEIHEQSKVERARIIIERNKVVVHDVRNPLHSPALFIEVFQRTASNETSTLAANIEPHTARILERLREANRIVNQCSEHQISIESSSETPAGKAVSHTNATRFALSEISQLFSSMMRDYLQLNLAFIEHAGSTHPLQEKLNRLGQLLNKLKKTVEDKMKVLDDSQLPSIVSVREVMDEAWLFSKAERRLSNIVTEAPNLPSGDVFLHINHFTLSSALLNLLVNACHSMRDTPRRELKLSAFLEGEGPNQSVLITVHDSGTGIAEEHRNLIFNPSFTTKPKAGSGEVSTDHPSGTGMGLYMVAEMMRQYGGSLDLETSLGQGSIFSIRLKAFNPRIGLDEHLDAVENARTTADVETISLGRKYTQALMQKADEDFIALSRILRTDPESLHTSSDRGIFLALLARHLLAEHPYPSSQRSLIRLHRMIELAYVRLDFEMIRAYRDNLDADVAQYLSLLIEQANKVATPEEHLAPLEAMRIDFPQIDLNSSRPATVSQVDLVGSRTVYETARMLDSLAEITE